MLLCLEPHEVGMAREPTTADALTRTEATSASMKPRLLDFICCPMCLGSLALGVLGGDEEVDEGRLECAGCARTFPVINAIPRLLPDDLQHLRVRIDPDWGGRALGYVPSSVHSAVVR